MTEEIPQRPLDDPSVCSRCGVHIGAFGDEYCEPCAREVGVKPPLRRCMNCGQDAPGEQMTAIDISPDDEYYPTTRYLCHDCSDCGFQIGMGRHPSVYIKLLNTIRYGVLRVLKN